MRRQSLALAVSIIAAFAFGGLLQSQGTQEPKSGHLVEIGKTYVVLLNESSLTVEFKVVEVVNDCWVKVEKTRKTYNYTHINLCSVLAMHALEQ